MRAPGRVRTVPYAELAAWRFRDARPACWRRQHTDRAFMHWACSGSVSGGVSCKQMIW